MIDEKSDSELDNFFRKELENLPEEKPSARDWQQMSYRLQSEGLNGNGHSSTGKRYFLLILLFILLSGLVSLPFVMKDKNAGMPKEFVNPAEKTENKAGDNASEKIVQTSLTTAPSENSPVDQLSSKHLSAQNKISGFQRNGKNKTNNNYSDKMNILIPLIKRISNRSGSEAVASDAAQSIFSEEDILEIKNIPAQVSFNDLNILSPLQPDSALAALTFDKNAFRDSMPSRRWRIGIYASLDYNYYTLKRNGSVSGAESDYVSQSNNIKGENWNGQFTVGVMGGYLFAQKISLEGGVFYSQKKQLHSSINTPAYANNSGEEYSDFRYDYRARYFEMYGRVKYYFYQKKNSLYATLGAAGSYDLPVHGDSSDYFLRTSYSESAKSKTDRVTLNASSAGLILVFSAGAEIPFGTRWNIYIEPAYRYSVDPVIKHPSYDQVPVQHFMRCLSLATGLMYKF